MLTNNRFIIKIEKYYSKMKYYKYYINLFCFINKYYVFYFNPSSYFNFIYYFIYFGFKLFLIF